MQLLSHEQRSILAEGTMVEVTEGKESDQVRSGVMESHVKSAVGSWSPGNKSSRLPRSRRRHRPLSPLDRRASRHHEL